MFEEHEMIINNTSNSNSDKIYLFLKFLTNFIYFRLLNYKNLSSMYETHNNLINLFVHN